MCRMIVVSKVRAEFHGAGRRVPRGFLDALDRVVAALVHESVCGALSVEAAVKAVRPVPPITAAMLHAAVCRRETSGTLDRPGLLQEARKASAVESAP